ncbi:MAG: hypothetical protein M1817_005875 [Caeruleum heppii]|nr:MAG: hypothetical protein M1817_005875 [Caeruleum heppii]
MANTPVSGLGSPMLSRNNSSARPARHPERNPARLTRNRSASRSPSPSFARRSALVQLSARYRQPALKRESLLLDQACKAAYVRRWDGNRRLTTNWDGLRRDPELWYPDGDCLVHLYGRGHSRRGPSFRLPYSAVRAAGCEPLLERFSAQIIPGSPSSDISSASSSDGGYFGNPQTAGKYELYIPAPPHCSREESFRYHLNTRNFFAWMFCKPIAGQHLGQALADLLERMNLFRSEAEDNRRDIMEYIDGEGYSDFRACADHALGVLYFAEQWELRELWTDAFVHCTGMNDSLVQSSEFEPVSRTSKALITRARLEMDIRLEHAGRHLSTFLENELSATYLGLGNAARAHLERFRSFLHSFYVGRFGYWPPTRAGSKSASFSRGTYRSMYFEFRKLYDYLADTDCASRIDQSRRPANGGICILQSTIAFDKRHRYTSLPFCHPRVPEELHVPQRQRSFDTKSLLSRSMGRNMKAEKRMLKMRALTAATNTNNIETMECPLVRSYMHFEKDCAAREEEKISLAEARKVRWLLVYAILQTLISVTRAPTEVRDAGEEVPYHLCCQIAGTPPWKDSSLKNAWRNSTSGLPNLGSKNHSSAKVDLQPDVDPFAYKTSITRDLLVKCPQPQRSSSAFKSILDEEAPNESSETLASSDDSAPWSPDDVENHSRWSSGHSSVRSSDGPQSDTKGDALPDMDHVSVGGGSSFYGDDADSLNTGLSILAIEDQMIPRHLDFSRKELGLDDREQMKGAEEAVQMGVRMQIKVDGEEVRVRESLDSWRGNLWEVERYVEGV